MNSGVDVDKNIIILERMTCTHVIFFVYNKIVIFKLRIPLTSLVSLLFFQAVFANTRICTAKQDECTTSVDSLMEIKACALSHHDKRHFLYSATTAQSTMDYSRKADEDVVDSPLSCTIIPVTINLPSPLRDKGTGEPSKSKCRGTNGAQLVSLNLGLSHSPNNKLHEVGLLYRLPSSALQLPPIT